jgi:acid-sensing ion channel, other
MPSYDDTFISIEPGRETNIGIERVFSSNYPLPYSSCTDLSNGYDSDLYTFILNSKKVYRQKDCKNLCLQSIIEDACQCYTTSLPKYASVLPCLNTTQIQCYNSIYDNYLNDSKDFLLKCQPKCPLECNSVKYNTEISSLVFPSLEIWNFYLKYSTSNGYNFSNYERDRELFYSLNIYYLSNEYTFIDVAPSMSVYGLLSSLGGSLGMFLGLSVFSLLEIFELIIKMIISGCFK